MEVKRPAHSILVWLRAFEVKFLANTALATLVGRKHQVVTEAPSFVKDTIDIKFIRNHYFKYMPNAKSCDHPNMFMTESKKHAHVCRKKYI